MSTTPTNILFVGNLPADVDRKMLYELGSQAGPVVSVTVPGEGGKNKGYGFVEYNDVETATYAIRLFEGLLRIRGRLLRVAYGKATGRSMAGVAASTLATAELQAGQSIAANGGTTEPTAMQPASSTPPGLPPPPPGLPPDMGPRFGAGAGPPMQPQGAIGQQQHGPMMSPAPMWDGSGGGYMQAPLGYSQPQFSNQQSQQQPYPEQLQPQILAQYSEHQQPPQHGMQHGWMQY